MGLLTAINIQECNPAKIRSEEAIRLFTKELCKKIDVKMYGETQIVMFGDEPRVHGYSMVQLIETSLVSGHFAEETNAVYLDVFSCKYYDPKEVIDFSVGFFEGKRHTHSIILRD